MILAMDLCNNESVLRGFSVLNLVITVIKILVPILIIIKTSLDLGKAVIASNDDEIKNVTKKLPRRLIAGLAIFFIPTIVDFIFNTYVKFEDTATAFAGCSTCMASSDECKDLINIAHAKAEAEKKDISEYYSIDIDIDEIQKEREKNQQNNQNNNNNNNNNNNQNNSNYQPPSGNPVERPTDTKERFPKEATIYSKGKYFDSDNVTKVSGLTEEEFINVLQNSTAYKGKAKVYIPIAKDLILAEKNHGVNAFYLIGLYSYESGWLGSEVTKKCNNIGGVRFYNQSYGNGKKTTNCLGRYAGFDSVSEFIDFHANLLEKKYLTPGASHYHGTSVDAIAHDYGAANGMNTIISIAGKVSGQGYKDK